jgi:hypothetical protein
MLLPPPTPPILLGIGAGVVFGLLTVVKSVVAVIVTPLSTYAVQVTSVQHPYSPVRVFTTQIFPVSQIRPLVQQSPPSGAQPPAAQHLLPAVQ